MLALPLVQMATQPLVSVIVPIYAQDDTGVALLQCALRALKSSTFNDFELIVADDGSPLAKEIAAAVHEAGATLIRLDRRSGPATARNAGARIAASNLLIFLDADTSVHPDTVDRLVKKMTEHPGLDAAIGSYDRAPSAPGTVSRFRNLMHSFVHHNSNRRAGAFWTGCGVVRRSRFEALGGFDESYSRPSIEDVEFGFRLRAAGGLIELDPEIQVTHHKRWTLRSMVHADFFLRAVPWARFVQPTRMPADLNFKMSDRISVALAAFSLPVFALAVVLGGAWWLLLLVALSAIVRLKWELFVFLARATSWFEALRCFPYLFVYLLTCAAGLIAGMAVSEFRRDRRPWPVA
jgi:GT2 family glycosyltransferase